MSPRIGRNPLESRGRQRTIRSQQTQWNQSLSAKVPRHHQLRKTRLEGSIPVTRSTKIGEPLTVVAMSKPFGSMPANRELAAFGCGLGGLILGVLAPELVSLAMGRTVAVGMSPLPWWFSAFFAAGAFAIATRAIRARGLAFCLLLSKTLLIPARDYMSIAFVNV